MPDSARHLEASQGPLRVVHYDAHTLSESASADDALGDLPADRVLWVAVDVDAAPQALEKLASRFKLHPLAVADALGRPQRAKYEQYPGFDFVIVSVASNEAGHTPRQICLFLGDSWVISTHHGSLGLFAAVREKLRSGGLVRQQTAGYLAYTLLSSLVDGYFPVIEAVGDQLEALESAILGPMDRRVIRRIQRTRRELLLLRRAIWPMRDLMSQVSRVGEGRFDERTRPYLRDVYDQTVQAIDLVEGYRDLSSGLVDLYLSTLGFRTNEVMKVLTIISTIFLPLTFIAGVYGMNFDTTKPANMPELHWKYGYLFSLLLMTGCVVSMLIFFWRKGWLGSAPGIDRIAGPQPSHGRKLGSARGAACRMTR